MVFNYKTLIHLYITDFRGLMVCLFFFPVYVQKADCIQTQSQEIQRCVDSKKDVTVSSGAGAMYSIDKDGRQYVQNVCG